MKVRAKFRVQSIKRWKAWDGKEQHTVEMSPVTGDDSDENKKFWDATPSGKIEIGCAMAETATPVCPRRGILRRLPPQHQETNDGGFSSSFSDGRSPHRGRRTRLRLTRYTPKDIRDSFDEDRLRPHRSPADLRPSVRPAAGASSPLPSIAGADVQFTGLGKFERRERTAGYRHNPRTGEKIHVAASHYPAFKTSATWRKRINATPNE